MLEETFAGVKLFFKCMVGMVHNTAFFFSFIAHDTPCRCLPCARRATCAGAKMARRILNIFMRVRV